MVVLGSGEAADDEKKEGRFFFLNVWSVLLSAGPSACRHCWAVRVGVREGGRERGQAAPGQTGPFNRTRANEGQQGKMQRAFKKAARPLQCRAVATPGLHRKTNEHGTRAGGAARTGRGGGHWQGRAGASDTCPPLHAVPRLPSLSLPLSHLDPPQPVPPTSTPSARCAGRALGAADRGLARCGTKKWTTRPRRPALVPRGGGAMGVMRRTATDGAPPTRHVHEKQRGRAGVEGPKQTLAPHSFFFFFAASGRGRAARPLFQCPLPCCAAGAASRRAPCPWACRWRAPTRSPACARWSGGRRRPASTAC